MYIDTPGTSNARNALLDLSKENQIFFLDDDDIISPNLLKVLYGSRSENSIVASHVFQFGEGIITEPNYIGKFIEQQMSVKLGSVLKCRKLLSSACAKLISRASIREVRFSTDLKIGEDSFFMACISPYIEEVKIEKTCIYYVNKREGSVTRGIESFKERLSRVLKLNLMFGKLLFTKNPKYKRLFILSRMIAVFRSLMR